MSLDDKSLQDAFASLADGHIADANDAREPVDPARIWAAAAGELSAEETAAIVDRMAVDPTLAEEWRLARELGAAPDAEVIQFPRWRSVGIGLALAAALLLGVRAALPTDPIGPDPAEFRDGEDVTITSALEADDALPRDAFTLRWAGAPEGSRYSLRVSTADLTAVDSVRGLDAPTWTIPAEKLVGLADGDALLWQVAVQLPDGGAARSATFTTRLRGE